jgi:hypothetical protein
LGGVILGGSVVLLASSIVKDTNSSHLPPGGFDEAPNHESAQQEFIKTYSTSVDQSKKKVLVLYPCGDGTYDQLSKKLSTIGVRLTVGSNGSYAIIDLRLLLKGSNTSFVSERLLNKSLVDEGLVMCPGEAKGEKQPGFFYIAMPHLSSEQIDTIVSTIQKVQNKFDSVLQKRGVSALNESSSNTAKPVEVDDEVESEEDHPRNKAGIESSRKRRKGKPE